MSTPTVFTLGKGAVLAIALAGSSTAAIPVKQLKSISFAGNSASYETITNMDSPGGVDEYAPTTTSPGTGAFTGVFNDNDAGQTMLAAAKVSQVLLTVTVQFKPKPGQQTGFLRTFNAYVQECNSADAQFDKSATVSGTFKITGLIVDTPGA